MDNVPMINDPTLFDPDKWYRFYKKLPKAKKIEFIEQTLDEQLPADFLVKLDFVELLFEWEDPRNPARYTSIIRKLRKHQEYYAKEYTYFEHVIVDYSLFLDDEESVAEALQYYKVDPVSGVDQLLPLVERLIYYGKTEMAADCARVTYKPINESPKLMGGAGIPLARVMYMWRFQQVYWLVKNGQQADWSELREEIRSYGFDMEDGAFNRDVDALRRLAAVDEIRIRDYPTPSKAILTLVIHDGRWSFLKHMLDGQQMDFALSEALWTGLFHFLLERKATKNRYSTWEAWFDFSETELEAYIEQKAGGFLSMSQSEAFAELWGVPYVYDYLLLQGVISETLYRDVLNKVAKLKRKLMNAYQDQLWKYAFVHRWPALDQAEKELIEGDFDTISFDTLTFDNPDSSEIDDLFGDMDWDDDSYENDDYDDYDENEDENEDEDEDFDGNAFAGGRPVGLFNPLSHMSSLIEHKPVGHKEKQKKKKVRKDAKKQRKKNRK